MSKPLVSIMIPTRKRPQGLCATVTNLQLTASNPNYEILIRYDDDDPLTEAATPALKCYANIRLFKGPRLGYGQLDSGYYAGLEVEARGHYVWIVGDDMLAYGDWYNALVNAPREKVIIQPEISMLGWSAYKHAEAQAFPIFPRFCWKPHSEKFPVPFDTGGDTLLKKHGFTTHFLKGVTLHHNEDCNENIHKHRSLT